MTDDTRLTLRRPPATNPVKLVFGERAGLSLSFWRPPVSTHGPVKLTFGDDGTAPPEAPTATLTAGGRITGLHGCIALQVGASVQVMGAISGLRGQIAVRALSMLQVSGTLTEVLFTEGQMVTKGQLLARIDPRPFEQALLQAQGTRQRDEAQLANARLTLVRYQTLLHSLCQAIKI